MTKATPRPGPGPIRIDSFYLSHLREVKRGALRLLVDIFEIIYKHYALYIQKGWSPGDHDGDQNGARGDHLLNPSISAYHFCLEVILKLVEI